LIRKPACKKAGSQRVKKNVLQKIWKPEKSKIVEMFETERKIINIFYLIRKPACKKAGSRRVLRQQHC